MKPVLKIALLVAALLPLASACLTKPAADDASRRSMATGTLAPLGLHLLDSPPG